MTTATLERVEPVPPDDEPDLRPTIRERLVRPMPTDKWIGWIGPLIITAIGGVLRFAHLGRPNEVVFDETYYIKDALSLWRYGYESTATSNADSQLLAGNSNVLTGQGSFVVHPPAGKWVIGLGEKIFGMHPFGWRFMVALLGTLSILLLARIARRMFRSTLIGCIAGLLLAVDGLAIVMSRTALLDGILMFWVLAGFGCLLLDRDRTRELLATRMEGLESEPGRWGPSLGWRPWRIAAGLMFGLACATKWNGLWYLAAFAVLTLLWDVGARRVAGVRHPYLAVIRKDLAPAFVALFVLALAVYIASWTGWMVTSGGYDRQWAATNPSKHFGFVPAVLRSLWHYHSEMWHFNVTVNTPHPYQSNPLGWLFLARPVAFAYDSYKQGQNGCTASDCSAAVTALGNPFIWWAAILAIPYAIWRWIARRDWRSGAILLGIAAGLLPWIHYASRTIFQFYTIVLVPFLVLAVTAALGAILGDENADPDRRAKGASVVGAYVALTIAAAAFFYPVWTAAVISHVDWSHRMWLPSWI